MYVKTYATEQYKSIWFIFSTFIGCGDSCCKLITNTTRYFNEKTSDSTNKNNSIFCIILWFVFRQI